jgi:heme A synthase
LWLIFGLGALQGAVGWWMVASGLTLRVEVSQYRLATHLVLALLIFATIVWTLRGSATGRHQRHPAAEDHQRRAADGDLRTALSGRRWSRACVRAGSTTPGPLSTAR